MMYSELSDHAKRLACDEYRAKDIGYNWWEDTYADAVIVVGFLGFNATKTVQRGRIGAPGFGRWVQVPDINFTGFSNQGDGACFRGDWAAKRVDMAGLMAHAPNDTAIHELCAKITLVSLVHTELTFDVVTINDSHYFHSGVMQISGYERDPDGDGGWTELDDEIEHTMKTLMREAADWIYDQLSASHDFIESDENVEDNIVANCYEFTEEGEFI